MKTSLIVLGIGFVLAGLEPSCAFSADLSVRQRLQRAIDVSRQLAAKAQPIDEASLRSSGLVLEPCEKIDQDKKPLLVPRMEDAAAYRRARPWTLAYRPNPSFLPPIRLEPDDLPHWPAESDAAELRKLLDDKDPAVRCMAIEALAILHQPDDVPRIGRMLSDNADGLPTLGWNAQLSAQFVPEKEFVAGGLQRMRSWHNRNIAATAHQALILMTLEDLTAKNFDAWWQRNRGGRNCVWYWQERLTRELATAEALSAAEWQDSDQNANLRDFEAKQVRILTQQQQRFDAVRQAMAEELTGLPAEVEAKVRLATINRYSTSIGVDLDAPLMGPFICARIGSDRLLELLERKNLWEEVNYNNLVVQVVGRAELFFTTEHLGRLRAIMFREHDTASSYGKAAFVVGISHLLPPAKAANLDDPNTRDGWLRSKMQTEGDLFARGSVAGELIRVGLPENWDFLKKEFFAETGRKDGSPDVRQSILQALGNPPLTVAKRSALLDVVLDNRFAPLWTQPKQRMGDDMYRQYAIWAINAHAGKELISDLDKNALADPAKSEKALAEVLRKIETLR